MQLHDQSTCDPVERMRAHLRSHVEELTGITDTSGIELASLIRTLTNLYEAVHAQQSGEYDLSGPRWGLLLRMFAEEEGGNCAGITPTSLSRFQSVSKNTISALLRGLEEQGLIQRTLDPVDRRIFRIQLTPEGRKVVHTEAPRRIQLLNDLTSGLSGAERESLIENLGKLYCSILANSNIPNIEVHGG